MSEHETTVFIILFYFIFCMYIILYVHNVHLIWVYS